MAAVATYTGLLAIKLLHHDWIVDGRGHPWVTDFLEVWVAGLSVLKGAPAAPYDWHLHHAAQVAVVGHPFAGFLGWHYPPLFLFVAGALALLPYLAAFLGWVVATTALYAAAIIKIARRKQAALFALALPAAFGNILVGQNGFLTVAIVGMVLLMLEKKPLLAGFFLALLTYKPQFGLVFPFVLLADMNWRALA
ncbi:MAG TPA: glycosyltransferase family 87 protein, partial [Rhizomicrobium sp.]|nr:glycosyltransferase family 87 protein [Rhizomicrobium sp.]